MAPAKKKPGVEKEKPSTPQASQSAARSSGVQGGPALRTRNSFAASGSFQMQFVQG